ncbi:MAG: hypothetical protein U0L93_01130 [Bacteroidales bacterium]|nr:hypothetical protein [Bacteroidales bacterium]
MKRVFEYVVACILVTVGAIPRKVMHIWYIIIASAWVISMIVMLLKYFGIERTVFIALQIIFGISTVVFVIWKFIKSDTWLDFTDCLDRLNGES